MLGCFLKHNKEVFKAFKGHLKEKDRGAKSSKAEKKKPAAKKAESSSSEDSSEDEKPAKKLLVGNKRKTKESSSESSSKSSDEDDKKVKNGVAKRQRSDSVSSRTRSHPEEAPKKAPVMDPPPSNYKF
jgi:nucleolin